MIDAASLPRFVLVGGSTAAIYLGMTYILVEIFALPVILASSLGCLCAVCFNYVSHYHWTFGSDAPHGVVLVKYLLMCTGGVAINGLVMHFGTLLVSAHYMLVQLFAALSLLCWSFGISSFWVFK